MTDGILEFAELRPLFCHASAFSAYMYECEGAGGTRSDSLRAESSSNSRGDGVRSGGLSLMAGSCGAEVLDPDPNLPSPAGPSEYEVKGMGGEKGRRAGAYCCGESTPTRRICASWRL